VNTKLFPASSGSFTTRLSASDAHALCNFLMASISGLEKTSNAGGNLRPQPPALNKCSSFAAGNSSAKKSGSASNCAVRSPTNCMPSRVNQPRKTVLLAGLDFIEQFCEQFYVSPRSSSSANKVRST